MDIKPENMLEIGSKIVLCDFGISAGIRQYCGKSGYLNNAGGTPGYIAPEVEKAYDESDYPYYGVAGDIFSLGKTIEELKGNTVSAEIDSIISRMTQFDPRMRPSAEDLIEELRQHI
jgi:serine/threonine protein kinase